MGNQIVKKKQRQGLLTAAGIFAVIMGLVFMYFGFFLLADSNSSISKDMSDVDRQVVRFLSLGGLYLMGNGIYHIFAGFYGAVNSGVEDCEKKCQFYGWIMIGISIVNVIIMYVITNGVGNRFNTALLLIPIIIAVLYCVGAALNIRFCSRQREENTIYKEEQEVG